VVQLTGLRAEASFDVAQAVPIRQLSESHAQKLIKAAEGADVEIASVFGN
jgi:hypothetical protein